MSELRKACILEMKFSCSRKTLFMCNDVLNNRVCDAMKLLCFDISISFQEKFHALNYFDIEIRFDKFPVFQYTVTELKIA